MSAPPAPPAQRGSPDIALVAAVIRETAQAEILPRFRRLAETEMWRKPNGSLATVADMESEARLTRALTAMVPGSTTIAEEEAESDPAVLERLDRDDAVWIVDPLDGTANFAAGRRGFAVLVAFVQAREVRAGWIHDPLNHLTVTAELGAGAWSAGRRLRVADAAPLAEMSGSLGGRLRRNGALCAGFAKVGNRGCVGLEYLALATGGLHFAHFRRLKLWDHAAGHLIHGEAGGHGATLDGHAWRPGSPGHGGLLLAPDRESWAAIAEVLVPALGAPG